jgi:hypothetical protein
VSDIDHLLSIMARLRDPETGCAWDLEQRFETIAPYTIEEAYDAAGVARARPRGRGGAARRQRPIRGALSRRRERAHRTPERRARTA